VSCIGYAADARTIILRHAFFDGCHILLTDPTNLPKNILEIVKLGRDACADALADKLCACRAALTCSLH